MAYKPTTGTSILDNDFRLATSEGVYEALQLKQDALPAYSDDKVLYSTASAPEWRTVGTGSTSAAYPANTVILGRDKPAGMTGASNILINLLAGSSLTSGSNNNFIGLWAGYSTTTGNTNNYFGVFAGRYATGSNNSFMGHGAGRGAPAGFTGSSNVAIGNYNLQNATSAARVTALGLGAGFGLTSGSDNVLIGNNAGVSITTGNSNLVIGTVSGSATLASTIIVAAGTAERFRVDSSGNMGIGTSSPAEKLDVSGNVKANSAILNGSTSGNITLSAADTTTSYSVKMPAAQGSADMLMHNDGSGNLSWNYAGLGSGNFGTNNVILGRGKPASFTGNSTVLLGANAGNSLTSATDTVAIGNGSLTKVENGGSNVAIGSQTLAEVVSNVHNTAIGHEAGRRVRGNENVFIGSAAGSGSATPANNTANALVVIGREAGAGITSLSNSVLIGQLTGRSLTNQSSETFVGWRCGRYAIGSNNTYFGAGAGSGNSNGTSSTGVINTAVGSNAGNSLEGSGNTLLGFSAGSAITTGSNNTIIGYNTGTTTLTSTIIMLAGNAERFRVDSSGNMGIGTSTPGEKLEVAGAVLATEYRVPNYRLDPHTHDEGTETGNFTINWANGAVHTVTLNAAGPLVVTMSNPVNGGAYALRIIQGATPGTVTWPANVKWPGGTPPTLSSSTGDIDIVNFLYFDDGGGNTFYYGTIAQDFA